MNPLTADQVVALFETAGQTPLGPPSSIATALSEQLAATAVPFAQIPFSAEPDDFAVLLRKER